MDFPLKRKTFYPHHILIESTHIIFFNDNCMDKSITYIYTNIAKKGFAFYFIIIIGDCLL